MNKHNQLPNQHNNNSIYLGGDNHITKQEKMSLPQSYTLNMKNDALKENTYN